MSKLHRMRRDRQASILPGALAAVAALAIGTAPAPPTVTAAAVQSPSREFVDPTAKPRRRKKKGAKNRSSGGYGEYFFGGRRARRRILIRLAEVPDSGRQWVRLRRVLRKEAPHLLTAKLTDLVIYAKWRGV